LTPAGRVTLALAAAAAASATLFVAADVASLFVIPAAANTAGFAAKSAALLWPIAFIVAAVHAVGVGLPAYLVASRLGLTRWWISLPGGFIAGALPYAILALPWRAPPPELVAAQIIQRFTWLHYAAMAGGLGLLGMAGGLAAWIVSHALGGRAPPRRQRILIDGHGRPANALPRPDTSPRDRGRGAG
jgi:hypothetical protein